MKNKKIQNESWVLKAINPFTGEIVEEIKFQCGEEAVKANKTLIAKWPSCRVTISVGAKIAHIEPSQFEKTYLKGALS